MKLRTGKMDIVVNTSMTPPHWAMLERQLINAQAEATVEFCNKYFLKTGYLVKTPTTKYLWKNKILRAAC